MHLARQFLRTREVAPPLAPVPRLLGAITEGGKVKFSKMQRLEEPRARPNKAIKCGGHGSVSRGTGVAVGVTMGGPTVIASTGAQGQQAN
jgi:hypothetical protein